MLSTYLLNMLNNLFNFDWSSWLSNLNLKKEARMCGGGDQGVERGADPGAGPGELRLRPGLRLRRGERRLVEVSRSSHQPDRQPEFAVPDDGGHPGAGEH